MRLFRVRLIMNTEIMPGVHLLEVHAPQLAPAVLPGQYCMLRCCDSLASDPFLRRPFFVHEVDLVWGLCRFLVYVRGRATNWLANQSVGQELDILGPLGRGWVVRPDTRNLLLVGETTQLSSVVCLVYSMVGQGLDVALLCLAGKGGTPYPAALLPPEVEYHAFTEHTASALPSLLREYLNWADQICCGVSRETLQALAVDGNRWREKSFAQVALDRSLPCGSGACFACQVETRRGPRLLCQEGPVFELSTLAEGEWT